MKLIDLCDFKKILLDQSFDFKPFEIKTPSGITIKSNSFGIFRILPNQIEENSRSLIYSCGIHGNETAPIEICLDILKDIAENNLNLRHPLLLIFGNIDAMRNSKRFNEDNMNRLFIQNWKNFSKEHKEAQRAAVIEEEIRQFFEKLQGDRLHYDLHTAIRPSLYKRFAVYPFLDDERSHDAHHMKLLAAMGIEAILFSNTTSTTLSFHTSHKHKAHAFTVELGKVMPFGQNIRNDFLKAETLLKSLLLGKEKPSNGMPILFKVKKVLIRNSENYEFNIPDDVANFTTLNKGSVISKDEVETYTVRSNDEAIVFPKGDVKVGQRSGLIVVPTNS